MTDQLLLRTQTVVLDPVDRAIQRLQTFQPEDGYWLAFSGGKDSMCIHQLAIEAGVKFEAHYNATTVDPPELVRHIKQCYPTVAIGKPPENMRQLIVRHHMPPTRQVRYCCNDLKERGGDGRVVITGVRWAESSKRRKRGLVELNAFSSRHVVLHNDNDADRKMVEACILKSKHLVNPIIDWSDANVWRFIRQRKLPYCSLYDEGFSRLGCIACPMTNRQQRLKELDRWPHFYKLYLRAFEDMIEGRKLANMKTQWTNADQVMAWWLNTPEYPMFD